MPKMPAEVKIAILLAWAVLAVKAADGFYKVYLDSDPNATFKAIWFLVTLASTTAVGLFIFFASKRRNWARIALLLSTLVAWSLWLVYPQSPSDYAVWKWFVAAALAACELLTLVFLFRSRAAQWYRQA
jgi:CDP-diglyceride synthetase